MVSINIFLDKKLEANKESIESLLKSIEHAGYCTNLNIITSDINTVGWLLGRRIISATRGVGSLTIGRASRDAADDNDRVMILSEQYNKVGTKSFYAMFIDKSYILSKYFVKNLCDAIEHYYCNNYNVDIVCAITKPYVKEGRRVIKSTKSIPQFSMPFIRRTDNMHAPYKGTAMQINGAIAYVPQKKVRKVVKKNGSSNRVH